MHDFLESMAFWIIVTLHVATFAYFFSMLLLFAAGRFTSRYGSGGREDSDQGRIGCQLEA